ncbi:MAG: hypothetical protein ACOYY3_08105 [Chloroflexota bacterium]
MSIEFDPKGKFFTDIITKEAVGALVQTTSHLLRGYIHVRQDARLKDELDLDEPFLAITDAKVLSADGQTVLYQTGFVAVQRRQIIWVIAERDVTQKSDPE